MYFTVPTDFKEDKYIAAMEARAGELSVVHHIVIYVRDPKEARARRQDIGTGLLGALSPGMTPFMAQPGTAKLIKAGSNLVFQMHYTPSGKVTKDRRLTRMAQKLRLREARAMANDIAIVIFIVSP
jgi:hypothetical protein